MRRSRVRRAAALVACALAAAACSAGAPETPPEPRTAQLSARREPLQRLLSRLALASDSRLGRRAAEIAASLPDCEELEASAAPGDASGLLGALRCAQPGSPEAALRDERGARALALVWPLGDRSLRASLSLDADGSADLELRLPSSALDGARGLLLPGGDPGPSLLAGGDALAHARLRPVRGLDLAALVPDGGQADRLFRLRSRLFQGAVLDGTWEAALYAPEPGSTSLRAALALGFRQRGAAVAAMEEFVAELTATWPVRRSFFSLGERSGACLLDLRILPDLAPCYLAGERALVVGWNPASLRKALARDGDGALPEGGGLRLELARFAEADARLAAAAGLPTAGPEDALPWSRVLASGRSEGDGVRYRIRLEAERS